MYITAVTCSTNQISSILPTFGNSLPENVAKDAAQINDFLAKSNTPTDPDEVDNVWEDSEWSEGQTNGLASQNPSPTSLFQFPDQNITT